LPRRLAALVYDTLLILPAIMAVVAVATAIRTGLTGHAGDGDYGAILPAWLVQLLAVSTVACFYGYFWCKSGQTLGMQAWRIRLRSDRADAVSARQALLRIAGAAVSLAAFGLGFLWCLFDPEGRYWHDRWSGSRLELLPKRK